MIIHNNDRNLIHQIDPIYQSTNDKYKKNYNDNHKTNDKHKNNCEKSYEKFSDILKIELKK